MQQPGQQKTRIVILGGGFAGLYTAMHLESLLAGNSHVEISLVNRENYFVFQPMLAEVISGSIGILDTVSPIRRLLKRTNLYVRDVVGVDLQNKSVTLSAGFRPRPLVLPFDHLVLALGTVTDFRGMPGLYEHALPFKNLADALRLRNHLIGVLEEAAIESDPELRRQLLTFVVAGGGFSGVEVVAELNDFVRGIARRYRQLDPQQIRVVLVHSGARILERELDENLGLYAQNILKKRSVEILLNDRLKTASPDAAVLKSGTRIPTKTLVSTVPASPHPLIESLGLPKDRGRLKTDLFMQVEGCADVWALGDCALVPSPTGDGFCPPTAQHATRQAAVAAHNIVAAIHGGEKCKFEFTGLGKMGALGHHSAVAEMFGGVRLSGFPAWLLWRTVYWWKLPGLDRKLKVGIAWLLDLLIPPESVQLRLGTAGGVVQAHYEPGEPVFRQGDLGDALYIILTGEAEVVRESDGREQVLARLGAGEYFGEMALLENTTRNATVRCTKPMDVLTLRQADFSALMANIPDLRKSFEGVMARRIGATKPETF
jgi:NADH dehydrogenase